MSEKLIKALPGRNSSRAVAIWLLIGVGMIVIQVMLGGITRLTESGLSITEWKPITGALPPLNDSAWQIEFDRYKVTDQFKYVHQNFTLSEFKFIFFWEWFHRVWARLMGIVFLVGFIYFLLKRQFKKEMILPMVILFLLGAVQGAIGWIMVKSGLVPEKYFVGHVELATHFVAALVLLAYTLWFALRYLISPGQQITNAPLQKLLLAILAVLFLQLVYGAFMAGLRAAITAPTWPDINGQMIPTGMSELAPFTKNFAYNPITIHFIHRGLAYLLFCMIFFWWIKARIIKESRLFLRLRFWLLAMVSLQVLLGILTLLNATHTNRLVWLGVSHQFTAMLLVMTVVCLLFVVKRNLPAPGGSL
ncbi:MAG: COX15/CtaA family protein [Ferruginibacter sp.]